MPDWSHASTYRACATGQASSEGARGGFTPGVCEKPPEENLLNSRADHFQAHLPEAQRADAIDDRHKPLQPRHFVGPDQDR